MPADPRLRDVVFSNAGVALAGTLAAPVGGGPSAGVVMVGGSGPTDRNNGTYFPPIRQRLLDAGITVLSYDKRGVGGSSGDWHDATMDDLAGDAAAALDFLRAQPVVRAGAAGLLGHSEGGWVVLRAAAARDDLPWVVTSGCPGMTPAAQDRHALAGELRQAGVTARKDIEDALALWDRLAEAGRRDASFAEATRLVRSAESPLLAGHWAEVDERLWEFVKRTQDHDPIPDALRLRCPHLAVFGGADQLVSVADSARRFCDTACHPDRYPRATLTVQVYPGAGHRIQASGGTGLTPGYLSTLTQWIKDHSCTGPDA